jgi:hypothetical protein
LIAEVPIGYSTPNQFRPLQRGKFPARLDSGVNTKVFSKQFLDARDLRLRNEPDSSAYYDTILPNEPDRSDRPVTILPNEPDGPPQIFPPTAVLRNEPDQSPSTPAAAARILAFCKTNRALAAGP